MSKPIYPLWKRLGQKTLYNGRMHIVEYDAVLPNGDLTKYEVDHSDTCAVVVIIKTTHDKVVLTHQFRFPLNAWIYDLPGGAKLTNETIEEAAVRECREEVGIEPTKLVKLNTFYPNPGRGDWATHIYYCEDFVESQLETNDPSETVFKVIMPTLELKKLIEEQKIVDPSLLIAWYSACNLGYINL
jgi:8-oxo-dGTP pyrophosphatase MutT (NUDIX family)